MGPLRFPGNPSCAFAPVRDPGRTDDPSPMTVSSMPPLPFRQQRLQRLSYRGYRGASAPAVYASRMMLPPPMQDSLPAGWLAFAGRELNPLDCDEGFRAITFSSSSPGFSLTLRKSTQKVSALQRSTMLASKAHIRAQVWAGACIEYLAAEANRCTLRALSSSTFQQRAGAHQ